MISVARGNGEQLIVATAKEFLQTGDGHFSPLVGTTRKRTMCSSLMWHVSNTHPTGYLSLCCGAPAANPGQAATRLHGLVCTRWRAADSVLALVPCGTDSAPTSSVTATNGAGGCERELDLGTVLRGAFSSALEVEAGRATAGGDGSVVAVALRTALRALGSSNGSVAPALRVTYRPSIRDGRGRVDSGTGVGIVDSPATEYDAGGLRMCCGDAPDDVAAATDHDSTDQAACREQNIAGAGTTVSSTGIGDARITRRQDVQSALLNIARSLNELAHDAGATSSQQLQAPALAMAGDAYESEDLAVALLLAIPPTLWVSLFPEKHAREATALEQLARQLLACEPGAHRSGRASRADAGLVFFKSGCHC